MSPRLNPFASETPGETLALLSLVVLAVVAALSVLVTTVFGPGGPARVAAVTGEATLVAAAANVLVTLALAAIYLRQNAILDRHGDILDRQVRAQVAAPHADTLRRRVIEPWLGDLDDAAGYAEAAGEPETGIPRVTAGGFVSAGDTLPRESDEVRVMPEQVAAEPFTEDFLQNHAPDVAELCDEIETTAKEYADQRREFDAPSEWRDPLVGRTPAIEPAGNFDAWAFERAVMLESDDWTVTRLSGRASNAVEQQSTERLFAGDPESPAGRGVVKVAANVDRYRAERAVDDALSDVIETIDTLGTPPEVSQAANRLDRLDDDCVELWQRLVEYRGRSIYPGDCRFVSVPDE